MLASPLFLFTKTNFAIHWKLELFQKEKMIATTEYKETVSGFFIQGQIPEKSFHLPNSPFIHLDFIWDESFASLKHELEKYLQLLN